MCALFVGLSRSSLPYRRVKLGANSRDRSASVSSGLPEKRLERAASYVSNLSAKFLELIAKCQQEIWSKKYSMRTVGRNVCEMRSLLVEQVVLANPCFWFCFLVLGFVVF